MNKKIFSFDAETDGLWGNPFAIAAIVYELQAAKTENVSRQLSGAETVARGGDPGYRPWIRENVTTPGKWVETKRIILRLPDSFVTNTWVRENVIPALSGVEITNPTYESMLKDFASFYAENKEGADVICHMGHIVEAFLFREMHRLGFIGDWGAPYPLYDVSGNLQAAGEDPTSVDAYAANHGLRISEYGTTHNPLYDCEVAAKCYINLNKI